MNKEYQNEYDLVDRYLIGDGAAGEKLYLYTIPVVRKYIFNRTKGSDLSFEKIEDILSETLYKSIEMLNRYSGDSTFSTFVIGIAKNKIMQAYKAHTKQSKNVSIDKIFSEDNVTSECFIVESLQYGKNPLQVIIEKEQIDALKRAFESLNLDYKQIIQMRLINKTPVKKVSEIIGKSVDAIDSLYRRAMKKFRENYLKFYFGATDNE